MVRERENSSLNCSTTPSLMMGMLTVVCCSFGPIVNGYDPPVKSVDPENCCVVFAGEN